MTDQRFATDGSESPTEQVVVVYRRDDGAIVHVHRVITEVGGEQTSDDDAAAVALDLARQLGRHDGDVEALLTTDLDPGTVHRVEVADRRLVAVAGDEDDAAD